VVSIPLKPSANIQSLFSLTSTFLKIFLIDFITFATIKKTNYVSQKY